MRAASYTVFVWSSVSDEQSHRKESHFISTSFLPRQGLNAEALV